MKDRLLSVKVPGPLLDAVDQVAEAQEMSRSDWVREAVEAGVRRDSVALLPVRKSKGGSPVERCKHPMGTVNLVGGYRVCGRCQKVLMDEVPR